MGASQGRLTTLAPEDSLKELLGAEYVLDRRLLPGSGRMMRTFVCHHRMTGEAVVVKSIWIRQDDVALAKEQQEELFRIKSLLKTQTHVAPFVVWKMGDLRAKHANTLVLPIVLMRSHVYTTLADRLETRPFLTHVEKLWILSQLLEALQALHDSGVVHGFLTSTQIGLTSWGHVVLLDIASYKSLQTLPDDDPSLYLYYFQELQQDPSVTGCYLAPERFHSKTDSPTTFQLTPAMDVFSAGCVLLETSLNGERALDLGDLMDLRKGKEPVGLQQRLQKIESSSLRAACRHMLHVSPDQRLTAREYLERLEIPASFAMLKPFMERMTKETPDGRLALAAAHYGDVLKCTVGVANHRSQQYFRRLLGKVLWQREHPDEAKNDNDSVKMPSNNDPIDLMAETEALLKKLESLNFGEDIRHEEKNDSTCDEVKQEIMARTTEMDQKALLIYLQLVLSNIRFVQRPSSKLVALQILDLLAHVVSDEALLQRILPATISLLNDTEPLIKAKAVMVMTSALTLVESFPPSDSKIFPQYIFKRVTHLITDPSLVVRVAFATCTARLAETAHRFLDISHAVRLYEVVGGETGTSTPIDGAEKKDSGVFSDDITKLLDKTEKMDNKDHHEDGLLSKAIAGTTLIRSTYNSDLTALHETVSRWVLQITADQAEQSSAPKRALLKDLARLCNFFGRDGVMAFILPQILAFLNDRRDWQLRAALFHDLPSVCYMIGRAPTEHFVLPCLETVLVDGEDQVMSRALFCLAALVDMGLLSRSVLMEPSNKNDLVKTRGLFEKYSPLLIYPSADVRHSCIVFVNSACKAVGFPDASVFLVPILRPYLRFEPSTSHLTTKEGLLKCLSSPWTKERLTDELQRLTREPIISPDGIQWTSIGRDLTEENLPPRVVTSGYTGSGQVDDSSIEMKSEELVSPVERDDALNPHLVSYLTMRARGRAQLKRNVILNPSESDALIYAIEGPLKQAQHIRFPQQSVASNLENGLPLWYAALQRKASMTIDSPFQSNSIRSLSELNEVYGLSITQSQTPLPLDRSTLESAKKEIELAEAHIMESAIAGEWGPECVLDTTQSNTARLIGKLTGLGVPPLSLRLGVIVSNPSMHDHGSLSDWKPKIDSLVLSSSPMTGHTAPVSRLAVSYDQRFFVSGSFDGTCRVWELGQIENSSGVLESSITYDLVVGTKNNTLRVNDTVILEQSHAVASAASDGSVHVWRIDLASSKGSAQPDSRDVKLISNSSDHSRVSGSTEIRKVDPKEGEVVALSHFNSLSASVLVFSTQRGAIHSWDLRAEREPFKLSHYPELGSLSAMSLGNDRNWLVTGTSRGYLALWDVRFQKMVKLWHHRSGMPVCRLAASFAAFPAGAKDAAGAEPRPFVFTSCGKNECAMFDLTDGSCRQSFRVLDAEEAFGQRPSRIALPTLNEINLTSSNSRHLIRSHSLSPIDSLLKGPTINSVVGSVGGFDQNYLITGGGDGHIRYWDFATPSKCFSVSGFVQQRPSYDRIDFQPTGRLMLCKHAPGPRVSDLESSRVPRLQQRGIARPENRHQDGILDLKLVQLPRKVLLSASRDASIKVWR